MKKYDILHSTASSRTLCMPHQQDAVDALNKYFNTDSPKRPQSGLVVMPTGSGKTFTAINWLLNTGVAKEYRILWLVHRQELIDQTYNEFEKQLGTLSEYGIKTINMMRISGNPVHNSMSQASRQDIYVCSILSVASKNGSRFIRRMLGVPGSEKLIVIIDEAHHATAPSYTKVLEIIDKINPNRILLGLTATPIRMRDDETVRLNRLFNAIPNTDSGVIQKTCKYIYETSLSYLIKTDFLAKPNYKYIQTKINGDIEYDLSNEDVEYFNRFGELTELLMKKVANSQSRNQIILNEYLDSRKHYGKTLIFAVNQLHAEILSRLFKEAGINCDYAISNRPDSSIIINDFKSGKLEVLINVQMLTEGSDVPDIQSVFITRETNSDSLLMQMVGRGLRGVKVGGTKDAYIVSFHDTWDRLQFWMKPEFVTEDVGNEKDGNNVGLYDSVDENDRAKTREDSNNPVLEKIYDENSANIKDLYEKLYSVMKVNISSEILSDLIPDGWYSVLSEDGLDINISVYRDQLLGYQLLEAAIPWIQENKPSVQLLCDGFFEDSYVTPLYSDLEMIMEYIIETGVMPEYYTFKERDKIDPESIAQNMIANSEKKDAQLYWLESYYKSHDIVRQIYRTFLAFRKSVMDTLDKPREAEAKFIDDLEEFKITADYHNLYQLYNQVIQQYPDLDNLPVNSINWSKRVVKSWFGICYKLPDNTYTIFINRLLCSTLISEEAIKFVMYHELLHASGLWNHNVEFRDNEWKYHNSDELDGELDEMILKYKFDFKLLKKFKFNDTQSTEINPSRTAKAEVINISESATSNVIRAHKFCRNCGNKLPIQAKFCDVCGATTIEY